MASRIPLLLIFSLSLLFRSALGGGVVRCEELSPEFCAFAISAAGNRCVAESYRREGETKTAYQCRTSEVTVDGMADWVESDHCVAACGADRRMVGISSDALLDPSFTERLCSPECYGSCPNMIDLYHNLAAGEGVVLSHLCETHRQNPIRAMAELHSSGNAAVAPAAGIPTSAESTPTAAGHSIAASAPDDGNSGATVPAPYVAISLSPAAGPAASISYEDAAAPDGLDGSVSAAAPSDISEYSVDSSSDVLDADPVPVPAQSPASYLDSEEDDPDY